MPHEWEDGGKTLTSCVYVELTLTVVESREKHCRLSRSLEFPIAMTTRCFAVFVPSCTMYQSSPEDSLSFFIERTSFWSSLSASAI